MENASFIANKIVEKKLSVRQTENLIKVFKIKRSKTKNYKDSNVIDLETSLSQKIGINVFIKYNKNNKGTITFEYKEIDQLNKIIQIIKNNY